MSQASKGSSIGSKGRSTAASRNFGSQSSNSESRMGSRVTTSTGPRSVNFASKDTSSRVSGGIPDNETRGTVANSSHGNSITSRSTTSGSGMSGRSTLMSRTSSTRPTQTSLRDNSSTRISQPYSVTDKVSIGSQNQSVGGSYNRSVVDEDADEGQPDMKTMNSFYGREGACCKRKMGGSQGIDIRGSSSLAQNYPPARYSTPQNFFSGQSQNFGFRTGGCGRVTYTCGAYSNSQREWADGRESNVNNSRGTLGSMRSTANDDDFQNKMQRDPSTLSRETLGSMGGSQAFCTSSKCSTGSRTSAKSQSGWGTHEESEEDDDVAAAVGPDRASSKVSARGTAKSFQRGSARDSAKSSKGGFARDSAKSSKGGFAKETEYTSSESSASDSAKSFQRGSARDSAKSSKGGSARDSAKSSVRGSARETANSSVRGSARDSAKSSVRGSAKDSAMSPERGSARDSAKSSVRGSARETAKSSVRGSAKDSAMSPERGSARDSAKSSVRGSARDSAKSSVRGSAKDSAMSPERGSARDSAKLSDRGSARNTAKGSTPKDGSVARESAKSTGSGSFKGKGSVAAKKSKAVEYEEDEEV